MRKQTLSSFYLFSLSVASFTGHERRYLSRRALLAAADKRKKQKLQKVVLEHAPVTT